MKHQNQKEEKAHHSKEKSIAARLSECANIRSQLQAIGAFTCANNARIVSEAMNRFVRSESAPGETFQLDIAEDDRKGYKVRVSVQLSRRSHVQSGVVLLGDTPKK